LKQPPSSQRERGKRGKISNENAISPLKALSLPDQRETLRKH